MRCCVIESLRRSVHCILGSIGSLGQLKVQGSKLKAHISHSVIRSLGYWVKLKAQRLTVENVGIVKSVEIAPVK